MWWAYTRGALYSGGGLIVGGLQYMYTFIRPSNSDKALYDSNLFIYRPRIVIDTNNGCVHMRKVSILKQKN